MNRSKNAEEIAYARCQILGPLLQSEMDPAKRAYEIRKVSEQHQLSERTVRRWLSRYAEDGFRGLMTKPKPAHDRSSSVTEEIILAHEIGHAVLHHEAAKIRAFHDFALYDTSSQMEYEANLFAAEYLLEDDEVTELLSEDTFFFSVAKELEVPPELLDFKFRILKRKGWLIESPIQSNSNFLKHLSDRGEDT